ncbi:DUF4222 domain-containing protein [Buttiauxella brennerae]|uniref:DUF4222 domain-containing protein n=1 Tax=Buttiauxella brennerae TaxID=82988 RepID=UPI00286FA0C6|nr:DUF4222 domain-containing protein [Buttiauxella brennerae]
MKKKSTQAQPEGRAQPEIEINSRWKDNWGVKITIKNADENRISYVRDGYTHPCICSPYRLRQEFTFLPEETKIHQEKFRANGLEKIREIREALSAKTTLPLSVGSYGYDKELL